MRRLRAFIAVAITTAFWCASISAASAVDVKGSVEFLMTGVRDARERLRQGIVRGTGTHAALDEAGRTINADVEFFYAFDWDKKMFRCEREEPRKRRSGGLETSRSIYLRMPGRSIQYNTKWAEVQILREDFGVRGSLHAFDLRAIGLLYQDSYESQTQFDEILDLFGSNEPLDVTEEGGGVYRIRWVLDGVVRRTIWVNRTEGFSVTRFEVSDRRVPPMPLAEDGWPLPFLINEAKWIEVNHVWVPATFRIHDRTGPDDSKPFWRYDHRFEWTLVNELLPDDLFDIGKLGAKDGTLITDYRGKAPIVEKVIGVENALVEGESRRKSADERSPIGGGFSSNWLLFGNLLVVAAVILLFAWRRYRR